MASLVADYGTSSGEESDSSPESQTKSGLPETEGTIPTHDSTSEPKKQEVNFFSATADSDSEEEETPTEDLEQVRKKAPKDDSKQGRLPNPLASGQKLLTSPLLTPIASSGLETSVFCSSYHKAEAAKNFALEQHVKMTSAEIQSKDGKKICWNFRKGRCRFGHKCKYSHGMDIPGTVIDDDEAEEETDTAAPPAVQTFNQSGPGCRGNPDQAPEHDDDSYMAEAKRKKRVGVTNALIPPKKAMHSLHQQREVDRPWTVQK